MSIPDLPRAASEHGLVELRQTCGACPSQWEGVTQDGRSFYARYRYGTLTWGFGSSVDEAVDASMTGPNVRHLGNDLDGVLGTHSMLKTIGLEWPRARPA